MLLNYLKIAFRNLAKNKTYSAINIVGLGMGMAVSILILLFVMHEFSYDKFHERHERIYRILGRIKMGESSFQMTSFSPKFGPSLKESAPEIEEYVRVLPSFNKVIIRNPEKGTESFYEANFIFADPSFLKVFSFKLKNGNPDKVLDDPNKVIISERISEKYFGNADPVGKVLMYESKHLMQVAGVIENPPSNSTIQYDFIVPVSAYPRLNEKVPADWEKSDGGNFTTYLLIDSLGSAEKLEKTQLSNLKYARGEVDGTISYHLDKLSSIHLGNNFQETGNTGLISIFALVAVLILCLALFNYMSLTTAGATLRAKEVGVRKIIGSGRLGLIKQFYTESALITIAAFALSFILVLLLKQPFYDLLNLQIDDSFLFSPIFVIILMILLLFTIIVTGSYPSLVLSGFVPIEVLKGKFTAGQKGVSVRKVLMVFQFAVSISLIICSLVVKNQLSFMQSKKLGLYKDQILNIPLTKTAANGFHALKNQIIEQSGVENVAVSDVGLFKSYNMRFVKHQTSKDDISLVQMTVDKNFVKTLSLEWKIKPNKGTYENHKYVLLNETAVKELGIKGNPIGQKIDESNEIGGVIRDFNFSSVKDGVRGIGLFVVNDTTNLLKLPHAKAMLYVRLNPNSNTQSNVEAIGKIFKKYESQKPFEYYFLDDAFNETFKTEMRMSGMFSAFTAVAIFIACMGLFGLVTFTAETRTKEIGIRKVLGASVAGIVSLLSKDFLKLILLSILLSLPIAYYFMEKWLQDFAYRIQIPIWIYATASVAAIVITLITISFQSIRAALMNPLKSLRSE
ncbi:ABC transporter permease [Dyadobacter sp. CY343]|uniref:ABC transporter permease n=1 Tax=Dyadobacter sp. CY343 TaxID=2907299 RepID=UPI001F2747F0|nr:ABC transporter permease [Dyadobacter sp. CY343]MCE7058864.1 ABC transporter permease [Dyadobacter sp. CY343]